MEVQNINPGYTSEKFWFALYTKPRNEFKAARQLAAAGVDYYLPYIIKTKQWSDRKKKIEEPLLRGYIFIKADEKERAASLELDSIIRCVFDMGRPAKIPEWQIDNLKIMLNIKTDFYIKEGLIPGAKVLIKSGPFSGVIGLVKEQDNEKTITVAIDLLNRSVVTHLPKDSLFEIIKE